MSDRRTFLIASSTLLLGVPLVVHADDGEFVMKLSTVEPKPKSWSTAIRRVKMRTKPAAEHRGSTHRGEELEVETKDDRGAGSLEGMTDSRLLLEFINEKKRVVAPTPATLVDYSRHTRRLRLKLRLLKPLSTAESQAVSAASD